MNVKVRPWLQGLMWSVCGFHLIVGLGLNVMPGFVEVMASAYGASSEALTPQFLYILKPLGAFMMALGVAAACAAWKPEKYRGIIYTFAGLFLVRALHRVILGQQITELFGISPGRNVGNALFFVVLAAALVVTDLFAHRAVPSEQPAVV